MQPAGVSDENRLVRFFCLGSEGTTYVAGDGQLRPRELLTPHNANCVTRMLQSGRGQEVVNMAIFYSESGSTAKQNGLLLAVAMCARQTVDPPTKAYCYQNLSRFCRTPTQLFMFIRYCRTPGNGNGWTPDYPRIGGGYGFRRAVSQWYLRFMNVPNGSKTLATLVTKYRKRNGWSHQDALRVAHQKAGPSNGCSVAAILKYIAKGFNEAKDDLQATGGDVCQYLQAVEDVRAQRDPKTLDATSLAGLVRQHHLTREHLNTQLLNFPDIWEALLEHMPMTAMIRNLGKM